MAAAPVVVVPPPITLPGPLPAHERKRRWIRRKPANESRANPAREKPTLKVFRTLGEKICVSWMLATCGNGALCSFQKADARGDMLLPSSMV